MRRIYLLALVAIMALGANAQNATNSPYSQYGYGALADQVVGSNIGMAGVHLGWREGNQVNFGNPASYSALDSLTFIFDANISLQVTNFTEGSLRKNANNSSFDYAIGAFRLARHVGMAFGVMPYSNVGYTYYNQTKVNDNMSAVNTYSGSGGLRQVFLGVGIEPLKTKSTSFSVGANVSYLWGNISRSIINSYSDNYVKTLSKFYYLPMNTIKVDFGAQLKQRITKDDELTLGATYSPGHNAGGDAYCMIISANATDGVADTTKLDNNGKLQIPTSFGAGVQWTHKGRIKVGFDFTMEKWGSVEIPTYVTGANCAKPSFAMTAGQFTDRKRFALGADYCVNPQARQYMKKIHLRAGAYYTTPYLKINGQDGPKEFGLSAGFGIPIINGYNNRSVLNVSAQWSHLDASGLIKENTFRINVGLTFNERWFAKWKLE